MAWWGWLALGLSLGTALGMFLMAVLVAAGREPIEDFVDDRADELAAWRRGER